MSATTNVLTEWRQAVMTQLDANLQDGGFTVIAGERDEKSRDRDLACVFAPPLRADQGNVNFARPVLLVRAWKASDRMPKAKPRDPEQIEQLMIDLATCLQDIQVLPDITGGGLYFFVTELEPDYEDWGVQATLTGWARNPATVDP